jgi:hypothetical protein
MRHFSPSRPRRPNSNRGRGGSISVTARVGQVQFANRPRLRRLYARRHLRLQTSENAGQKSEKGLFELLLTREIELSIVRPPFGKFTDFL